MVLLGVLEEHECNRRDAGREDLTEAQVFAHKANHLKEKGATYRVPSLKIGALHLKKTKICSPLRLGPLELGLSNHEVDYPTAKLWNMLEE